MIQAWPWILTVVGVIGFYLSGAKKRSGWMIGIASQGLWLAYAITTKQWGFIPACAAYGTVYYYNWCKWKGAVDGE